MDTHELDSVKRAIAMVNGSYHEYGRRSRYDPKPKKRQWDRVLRVVCLGCGRTLGRFELLRRLAFCFNCRSILFPETVSRDETQRSRYTQSYGTRSGSPQLLRQRGSF